MVIGCLVGFLPHLREADDYIAAQSPGPQPAAPEHFAIIALGAVEDQPIVLDQYPVAPGFESFGFQSDTE